MDPTRSHAQSRSPLPRQAHRLLAAALAIGVAPFAGCGGGTATADDVTEPPPEQAPVEGTAELRTALADAGITAAPAAATVSDELFLLGQALFFDKELSGNRDVSCATCHWPELATTDQRTLPRGVGGMDLGPDRSGGAIVPRNSPAVLHAGNLEALFHDGRVERLAGGGLRTPAGAALSASMRAVFDPRWELLAAQAMLPVTSRGEMRGAPGENEVADRADTDFPGIWSDLRDRLLAYTEYQQLFLAAYPAVASLAEIEFAHAANALAAFEVRAFSPQDSPFDRFVAGDDQALTAEQVAGGREFFGRAGCARCHAGNTFTDERFHNIGLPQFGPGQGDGASTRDDFGRERVTGDPDDRYRFRTAPLRDIARTAPYGHVGQYATLTAMVRHYTDPRQRLLEYDFLANVEDAALVGTQIDNTAAVLANLSGLVNERRNFDVDEVVAFLGALSTDSAADLTATIPARVPSGLPLR